MYVYVDIPMTQCQCPFNLGKPDLSDRGGERERPQGSIRNMRRISRRDMGLHLSCSDTGILRVKAVTRLRNRLYGIPIAVIEIGWKRKWAFSDAKTRKMWLDSASFWPWRRTENW
jgi:hypothetical protein